MLIQRSADWRPSAACDFRTQRLLRALLLIAPLLGSAVSAAAVAAAADAGEEHAANPTHAITRHASANGIAIDLSLHALNANGPAEPVTLTEGTTAEFNLQVSDASTGLPVPGVRPRAWLTARSATDSADTGSCLDLVKRLLGSTLSRRAEQDLNSYLLLTLNTDRTISVINPLIQFNNTQLQSIVLLPAEGADWAMPGGSERLFVSMPEADAVAVVDLARSRVERLVPTGAASQPRRIALQPDGRQVWVALDGAGEVVSIDADEAASAGHVPVGRGLHSFAFTADSDRAFVSNSESDSITAIDTRTRLALATLAVGRTPTALAFGRASDRVYFAEFNGGTIGALDPVTLKRVASIPVGPGIVALGFEPQGRFLLALNHRDSLLVVIDTATDRLVGTAQVAAAPDQLTFTDRYAYVRGLGSEKISLIDLKALRNGTLAPVDIQAGREVPGTHLEDIGVADMMVPTPEGNAMMIANPADRTIYFYQEGMMATSGALSNYQRIPRAAMLLDRSLRESAPGRYGSVLTLRHAGAYRIPVVIDQPRVVECFDVTIDARQDAGPARPAALRAEIVSPAPHAEPGAPLALTLRIVDTADGAPVMSLDALSVLLIEWPGSWQKRTRPQPMGGGSYLVSATLPHAGEYRVIVSGRAHGATFGNLPAGAVTVREAPSRAAVAGAVTP